MQEKLLSAGKDAETMGPNAEDRPRKLRSPRTDKKRLHAMRHAILSQHPLEALVRLGENSRRLRRIERMLWDELQPPGVAGAILFDRFWSSYLRCLLGARAEANALAPFDKPGEQDKFIKEAEFPVLVSADRPSTQLLSGDTFKLLELVAKYDGHFAREMYRALAMLLTLRNGGVADPEQFVGRKLGLEKEIPGGQGPCQTPS